MLCTPHAFPPVPPRSNATVLSPLFLAPHLPLCLFFYKFTERSCPSFSTDSALLCSPLMAETVVLRVAMSCQGCAGAVKRVLTNMEGVESFEVDLQEQKVTVKGNVTPDAVFQTVSKSGKKTSFWEGEAKEAETVEPASASPEAAPDQPVLEAAPAAATA